MREIGSGVGRGVVTRLRSHCVVRWMTATDDVSEPRWDGEESLHIHPQDDQYIAFAGLYDVWQRRDGEDLHTFTVITTDADPFMARFHNRMPVILARDHANTRPHLARMTRRPTVVSKSEALIHASLKRWCALTVPAIFAHDQALFVSIFN
jgi:hypothetical protein